MMEEDSSNGDFEFVEGSSKGIKIGPQTTLLKPIPVLNENVDLPEPLPLITSLPNLNVFASKFESIEENIKPELNPIRVEPIACSVQSRVPSLNPEEIAVQKETLFALQNKESKSVWGWITNNNFLNKVAEKALNSVDTMITTLDPGMKEFIYSGGDIDIIVASQKDLKVISVREAFQSTFGRATVNSSSAFVESMAPQPVGYTSGIKSAEERINIIQKTRSDCPAVVAIEAFLVEILPDRWFEMSCLILRDDRFEQDLQVFTQPTPVPPEYIAWLQDQTPSDYPLLWSGFSKTIGEAAFAISGLEPTEWHAAVTGITRKELLVSAARALSGMYKLALRNI